MGDKRINYIELLRAIKKHWEPVFQDKVFWRGMLRWVIGSIVLLSMFVGVFSLAQPSSEMVRKLMDEIQPPQGAKLVKSEIIIANRAGSRIYIASWYEMQGMEEGDIRSYYKKELERKGWSFKIRHFNGEEIYTKNEEFKYNLSVRKSSNQWEISIYEKENWAPG